jgi:hypothetical protein
MTDQQFGELGARYERAEMLRAKILWWRKVAEEVLKADRFVSLANDAGQPSSQDRQDLVSVFHAAAEAEMKRRQAEYAEFS